MVKTSLNWKTITILLLMGMMVHTATIAMDPSSSSSMRDVDDTGFNAATMLDASHPSGLNLQVIVNDQHQRRGVGKGTGFSTDVILIANNKETLFKLAEQMDSLVTKKNNLAQVTKPKNKKEHQKQMEQIDQQMSTIVAQMKGVRDVIRNLKERVSRTSGVDYNQLENIPRMRDMPRVSNPSSPTGTPSTSAASSPRSLTPTPRMPSSDVIDNQRRVEQEGGIGRAQQSGELMEELRNKLAKRQESTDKLQ